MNRPDQIYWLIRVSSLTDLLLLQDIIRAPLNRDVEILVRQATKENMRETLKEVERKGIRRTIAHFSVDDSYHLLKAVSFLLLLCAVAFP